MENSQTMSRKSHYGRLASVYEYGAWLGSNGKIQESKRFHLDYLEVSSKVLYPGPGWGLEVIEAVRKGLIPTIVEWDQAMLDKAIKNFDKAGIQDKIECIHTDILEHKRSAYYDCIVANYFLDVFPPKAMIEIFRHLISLLKPGGKIFLSGYAPLTGSRLHRIIQWFNHFYANVSCKLMVNNAIHDIYDYENFYQELALDPFVHHDFKHFGTFGPRFHRVWVATKPSNVDAV